MEMENNPLDQSLPTPPTGYLTQEGIKHLKSAAKWAKLLTIVGILLFGIAIVTAAFWVKKANNNFATVGACIYLGFLSFYFFIELKRYRFVASTEKALASNDEDDFTDVFKDLNAYFRLRGRITLFFTIIYISILAFSTIIFNLFLKQTGH